MPASIPKPSLHYPWDNDKPAPGAAFTLHPDVRWLRFPLPFSLDHINLWLVRDQWEGREGWAVVDCCIANDDNQVLWQQIFDSVLEGLPIVRVFVTHMHPDHIGLASWLCQTWDAPMYISATDFGAAHRATKSTLGFGGERAAIFFAAHGLVDPESVAKIRGRANYYPSLVPAIPTQFVRLMEGDLIRMGNTEWRCISGYGHSPEHMALYSPSCNMLISGDMLLPKISTNISVYDVEPLANPLPLFLHSIDKFTELPPETLVLPSHGLPFTGINARVQHLHQHHEERLQKVLQSCATSPKSAFDLLPVLFSRKLDIHQTTFAMGESIAHLHALWYDSKLTRKRDADTGIYLFSTVS